MPRIKEIVVYSFAELSESAKANALQKLWDINVYHHWYDYTTSDFKDENEFFDVDNVYFSLSYSQGDGAMFEYSGVKDKLREMFAHTLSKREKVIFAECTTFASGKHRGHYYHPGCCEHSIGLDFELWFDYPNCAKIADAIEENWIDFVKDKYNDLCHELYKNLNREYDYLTSETAIIETIECNEYEFDEYGNIA